MFYSAFKWNPCNNSGKRIAEGRCEKEGFIENVEIDKHHISMFSDLVK